MSTKEQAQHNDRTVSKEQHPVPEEIESPAPAIHPSALQRASERPHARPEALLQLQRLHGNRAVGQMLARRASAPAASPQPAAQKATTSAGQVSQAAEQIDIQPEATPMSLGTVTQRKAFEVGEGAPERPQGQTVPQTGSIQRTIDRTFMANVGLVAGVTSDRNKDYKAIRDKFTLYQEVSKKAKQTAQPTNKNAKKPTKAVDNQDWTKKEYDLLKQMQQDARIWLESYKNQNKKKEFDLKGLSEQISGELKDERPRFMNAKSDRYIKIMDIYKKEVKNSYISSDPLDLMENKHNRAIEYQNEKNPGAIRAFLNDYSDQVKSDAQVMQELGNFISNLAQNINALKGLTPAERAAIQTYTNQQYLLINPAMSEDKDWHAAGLAGSSFKGESANPEKSMKANKKMGKMAKSGMSKLPEWKQTQTIYRGEVFPLSEDNKLKKGEKKTFPHFVSVSMLRDISYNWVKDKNVAERPIKVLWVIGSSKNGKDVAPLSKNPQEKEILFPPSTTFHIQAEPKAADAAGVKEVRVVEG